MAERSFITQVVQLGVENIAAPGVAVPATKRMQTLNVNFEAKSENENFRPAGYKYDTVTAENREWVDLGLTIAPTYTELQYVLASIMGSTTPTQLMDGGTATGAYQWVFNSNVSSPDTPQTYTIQRGSAGLQAEQVAYGQITDFGFNFTREKLAMTGKGMAQQVASGVGSGFFTPTGVGTNPLIPIIANQGQVFLDTTYGNLGQTKIARVFSVDYTMDTRFGSVWIVDSATQGYAATVEVEPKTNVKLIVEADAFGMGTLLPALRSSNTFFMRHQFTGPTIYVGGITANYLFRQDLAVKVNGIGTFSNQQGVYAIEFNLDVVSDAGWGHAVQQTLINTQSSL